MLPNRQALRRKINQILKSLDTTIATGDRPADGDGSADAQRYDMTVDPDGAAHLHAFLGAEGTKVVLNMYKAGDRPDSPAYVPGAGCDRPATRCQKDHRIDDADGGPTAARNLLSLCRHHHNEKTARRAFHLLALDPGVVYWLFDAPVLGL